MDDRPGGAEVPVGGLHLADGLESTFRLQMVLERSHDVATAGRKLLVLGLGLGLVGQRGRGQAQARGSAVVGSGLATVTVAKKKDSIKPNGLA